MSTINISLTQLRPKLPQIIGRVAKYFDRCVIMRHGKPEAVIIAEADYENLLETLDILSDTGLMKDIKQGQDELCAGKGIPWERAKEKLSYVRDRNRSRSS